MGDLTHDCAAGVVDRGGMTGTISHVVLRDGRRLGFEQLGRADGPPVLYFPGAGSSCLSHPPGDAGADEVGVRLISVERPGVGGSDPKPDRRLADWPADVAELADQLGIDRFAVLGWSAGGPHALACAAALPDRVTSCGVLFGAVAIGWPGWDDGVDPLACMVAADTVADPASVPVKLADFLSGADPESFLLSLLEQDPTSAALAADAAVVEQLRANSRRAFEQGTDAWAADFVLIYTPWDFDLAGIRVPVEIFAASEDRMCPVSWSRRLESLIPGAELTVIDGIGHNHGYDRTVFAAVLEKVVLAAADARS